MTWQQRIDAELAARRAQQTLRVRMTRQEDDGRHITREGRQWLNVSGNDYLGLSHHPEVIQAWQQGAARYGVGSGGSGHVTGYCEAHQAFEQQLALWLGYPRALLFISGFAANQAVISALTHKDDFILADKLSHASLIEAAMQSPATLRRFAHNQTGALERLLVSPAPAERLVVTEGVFSMDGDSAPLADIATLATRHDAWLMVDDAHGIGVVGHEGRGSCARAGIQPDLLVVTFGKAFGVSGAAVLCSESVADYLLQFARHLIYSTAMPPAQAMALCTALTVVRQADDRRATLQRHIQRFRDGIKGLPLTLAPSETAIQPLIVGDNARALQLAEQLRVKGIWATAIRPPTVPPGSARLRLTLTAAHHDEDISRLLEALHACCGE